MAKYEIPHRTANPFKNLIWKYWLRVEVIIPWPRRGWVTLFNDSDGGIISTESSDPNDWIRPWLESNAGKQGTDWEWRCNDRMAYYLQVGRNSENTKLVIRFRDANVATMFALKFR